MDYVLKPESEEDVLDGVPQQQTLTQRFKWNDL